MNINNSGRKIIVDVKKTSFLGRGLGLTFRTREARNLLFDFRRDTMTSITSFFVFFPFLAVWLDSNNKVIDAEVIKPFRFMIKPSKKFRRLVEIPLTKKNAKTVEFFVGKGKSLNSL